MLKALDTSATKAGSNNNLEAATAPAATNGVDDQEAQLVRLLARVPPIITLPKPKQKCPYSGMSRTGLLELVAPGERNGHTPPVRAIYRRSHKYAVRGKWLIPSENLFRYLLGLSQHAQSDYERAAKLRDSTSGKE